MKNAIAGCLTLMLLAGITVKSATAMTVAEEYGWFNIDNSTSGGGGAICGSGSKTLCRIDTTSTCSQWQTTSGPSGVTATCTTVVDVLKNYYYP